MRPRHRPTAATAILATVCALALTGCSEDPPQPRTEPSSTSTTGPAITLDPGFYTWQQRRAYTGEKANIATTVHAADYYAELPMRPGGGIAPELEQVATQPVYGLVASESFPEDYPHLRGPVTARLMSIHINGDRAVVIWCRDDSEREVRASENEAWHANTGSGYFEFSRRFVASSSSPTGWRMGKALESRLTSEQCQRVLQNKQPRVSTTGPPERS